jgi:YHS domain-containing protein
MHPLTTVAISFALAFSASGCTTSAAPSAQTTQPPADPAPPAAERVTDARLVCMVNNQYMGAPQIPVPVAGKVYYGCCEACRERLLTDASLRTARDPLTQQPVDKADAIMAREPGGAILYFASEDNLKRYRP